MQPSLVPLNVAGPDLDENALETDPGKFLEVWARSGRHMMLNRTG